MSRFGELEREARRNARIAFPGCKIYCRRDRGAYVARIDLLRGSWCSTGGVSRAEAIENCLALAREPAPGFPGWVEPAESAEPDELALT
jgi:hypothetical protein